MFCRNCGAQNQDGAAFCHSCGASLSDEAQPGGGSKVLAQKKPNLTLIGIAAVAVVAVILVIFAITRLFGGNSPEKAATKFVNSVFKGDGKAIVSMLPDEVVETIVENRDMTKKEMISDLNDSLESSIKSMDRRYDKWSVTCKVLDSEDLSNRELDNLIERYKDRYDVKVTDAKKVSVKATLKADDTTDSSTIDIITIKVKGSWYLDYGSVSSFW